VNIIDQKSRNPLLLLSEVADSVVQTVYVETYCSLFEELLEKNCDPNCKDTRGSTPLTVLGIFMLEVGHPIIYLLIILLLKHGADISMHSKDHVSFYSLFKKCSRLYPTSSEVQDIQDFLQVPSLLCLATHATYEIRDKVKLVSHLPKQIKSYLNLD